MSDPHASLTLSTDERNTMFNDHHFTGPYAPSIPDEDIWADFGDHAEDIYSDEGGEDAAMEGHLFGWDA
jgi:hypothetical protein